MKKTTAITGAIAALWLLPVVAWSNGQCTMQDLQEAASGGFAFPDWKALYVSYSRFKSCDQGGDISEGYSESVVRLLADHWDRLPELAALSGKHRGFTEFVLRHIDATTNDDDLKKIAESSGKRCPLGVAALCAAIHKQAKAAIEESGS